MRKSKKPFRQILLSESRRSDGLFVALETLRKGQKGPRRQWRITGDGVEVCRVTLNDAPTGIKLDWLEDNPHKVEGLDPDEVREIVDAVRSRGGWFTH